jgi:arginine repressor
MAKSKKPTQAQIKKYLKDNPMPVRASTVARELKADIVATKSQLKAMGISTKRGGWLDR